VHCDIANFGERIAATTLDWLEKNLPPPPVTRTPVELVIRDSSASQFLPGEPRNADVKKAKIGRNI
jgi:hypothetical protein